MGPGHATVTRPSHARRPLAGKAGVAIAGLTATLLAAAVPAAPSYAADQPNPTVAIDPGYGPPLSTVKVSGYGFCAAPCPNVNINIAGVYVANTTVTAKGRFSALVQIPGSARPGSTPVIASQTNQLHGRTTFTVTISAPAPHSYPRPSLQPLPGGRPATTPNRSRQPSSPAASTTPSRSHSPTLSATSTTTPSEPVGTTAPAVQPTSSNLAAAGVKADSQTRQGPRGWRWVAAMVALLALVAAGLITRRRTRRS